MKRCKGLLLCKDLFNINGKQRHYGSGHGILRDINGLTYYVLVCNKVTATYIELEISSGTEKKTSKALKQVINEIRSHNLNGLTVKINEQIIYE